MSWSVLRSAARVRAGRQSMLHGNEAERSHRLRKLILHAYQNVKFYRKLWDRSGVRPETIRGLDDIARLPIVSRKEIQAATLTDRLASGVEADDCVFRQSGGSTGVPITILTW